MTIALLCIDMQMGMAERIASGRARTNLDAEEKVAGLMALFRVRGLPVVHVLHDEPGTPFVRDLPGGLPMPCATPAPGEMVFWKSRSSAFSGTGLDAHLRQTGVDQLVIIGAVAAFCVTTTTRIASDLGFRVFLPRDALLAFDIPAHDGGRIDPETVLRVTLSLLGADFAQLVVSDQVAGFLG